MNTIYTDENGRLYERPERPEGLEFGSLEWVEYQRAVYAYKDRVQDAINRGFDKAFRAALRRRDLA
jgi:hypothetical protein